MKLATALTKACTGDIGNKIALASENAVKDGYVLRGRQIYRMVIDYFRVSEEQGALFDLTDLMSVRMSGGDLTSFLFSWKTILNGMKHVPEEPTKLHLFYTQVKEFKGIEWELEIYARAKPGDKERTYDYLLEACESYLTRKRLEKNRKAVERQVGRGHNAAPAPSGDGGSSSGKGGKGNRKKVKRDKPGKGKRDHSRGRDESRGRSKERGRSKGSGKGSSKGRSKSRGSSSSSGGGKGRSNSCLLYTSDAADE